MDKTYNHNYGKVQLLELWKQRSLKMASYFVLTGIALIVINAYPDHNHYYSKNENSAPTPYTQVSKPGSDFGIKSAKLYGSRDNPKGRVVALVKDKNDISFIRAQWNTEDDLSKDVNKGIHTTVTYTDRWGREQEQLNINSLPAADLDGDNDVDSFDLRAYHENPTDFNLDGVTDNEDLRTFKSWIGWKKAN